VSTSHTYAFSHTSNSTLRSIHFEYCTTPSGTCVTPASLITTSAAKGTITGLTNAQWTLENSTAGTPRIEHLAAGETVPAATVITVPMTTITNHAIDNCQAGGDTSTDTCYVRITSYTGLGTGAVDTAIVSYTVVAAVTVSARVDPSFTFVVQSVDSNQVRNGITTSAASTFSTLPFGNLTAGTPKYVAHGLRVTTNTQGGYTVSARMLTQMTGNYAQNNIDPFMAPWTGPTTWTEPTGGTPNDNTGWIGANTTDTDISNWNGDTTALFGTIGASAVTVMQGAGSDNGTNSVYVTYAIEANVFQPADTYSGVLQYNALPTY
jgi:hypothetical protein